MPPKKDPNKPKGRMSAYAFFVQDRRSMYREKGQDVQFTEFSKECSSLWKEMGEPDSNKKDKYNKMSEADKERYQREMALYVPPEDSGKKKKKVKDPNLPKRPMSGFFWFGNEKRPKLKEQNPNATVGEIAKQLGAAWKIMTADQKAPYEESHRKDKIRYDKAMEAYKKGEYVVPGQDNEEDYSDED